MEIEFLRSDGSNQVELLDVVPVVVSLPAGPYYGENSFEVFVYQINEQGEKLKKLFRQEVFEWDF